MGPQPHPSPFLFGGAAAPPEFNHFLGGVDAPPLLMNCLLPGAYPLQKRPMGNIHVIACVFLSTGRVLVVCFMWVCLLSVYSVPVYVLCVFTVCVQCVHTVLM